MLNWLTDRSGEHNDYNIALNVASYLKQEKEYLPWKSALGTMLFVKRMLSRTPEFGKFKVKSKTIFNENKNINCIPLPNFFKGLYASNFVANIQGLGRIKCRS